MRSLLLASSLLLAPGSAFGASQCVLPVAAAAAAQSEPQTSSVAPVPPPTLASVAAPPLISADQVERVPALRRIASAGAQLFDLGTEHGLRTVFARNGSVFQVFYITADGQAAVGGVMWDASGQNVTKRQVAPIEGTIPTVTIATSNTPPPASPTTVHVAAARAPASLLRAVEGTTYGTIGPASAPRLYLFVDPLCRYSVRAMEQLRPYVASGRVQLAVIPLSVLDGEGQGQGRSTLAAKAMLSLPSDAMAAAWSGNRLDGPADPNADARLVANTQAAESIGLRGTPTFVWRKRDGSEGRADGIPGDLDALVASIGG